MPSPPSSAELRARLAPLPLDDFDYHLPGDRIAQVPLEPRDSSRLLVLTPGEALDDRRFTELPTLLEPGDLLVANDTRVRAARLRGRRSDGGPAEVLLLHRLDGNRFTALVRPGRRLHEGARVSVGGQLTITVLEPARGHPGAREVILTSSDRKEDAGGHEDGVDAAIAALGEAPLPPYITVPLPDAQRYQTVYAAGAPASAAAPTAGLHFTARVQDALRDCGVEWTTVRLEVGLGTFAPITSADVNDHSMHEETCTVPEEAVRAIAAARERGGRVVAVGTTVARTLESAAAGGGCVWPGERSTDLFIRPGFRFSVVDGLLTNFHQPRSSLLVLLAALVGARTWRAAYDHALEREYRFLSFGDCMLCWRDPATP